MYLTLRLDDVTPEMNRVNWERFRKMMDAHGIRPLLGVVPDARDEKLFSGGRKATEEERKAFFEELLALQKTGYSIAMHGLTHVYTTKAGGLFPLNRQSELAGLPYERQREMIAEGKRILSSYGIETDLFMAPSHSFDVNTLKALMDCGFTRLTDGFGYVPYRYLGMTFYPISFLRRQSVERARRTQGTPPPPQAVPLPLEGEDGRSTTLVVHTDTLTEKDFAAYEEIFRTCKFLPYDALFTRPVRELSRGMHCIHYLMATVKRLMR